jgi:dolichyl-phosphate-mannose-protein mannosyltransferase
MPAVKRIARSRGEFLFLAALLLLSLQFRLAPMNRGLGQDELYTAVHFVEGGSLWNIITSSGAFNNHVGYSLMARFSETLWGHSEWALRLPALSLGLLGIYSFFLLSRSILTHSTAMLATVMFALSPPHIVWSVTARGYSALIFSAIVSSYLFLKLLRRPNLTDAAVFILVSAFGIYVHLYCVFVSLVQIVFLIAIMRKNSAEKKLQLQVKEESVRVLALSFLLIIGLAIVCYAPLSRNLLHDLTTRGRGRFEPVFPLLVVKELSGGDSPVIASLFVAFSMIGYSSLRRTHQLEANYFLWLLVGPLLLMWTARPFDLYTRFFVYWLPCFFLFFTAGLGATWQAAFERNAFPLATVSCIAMIVVLAAIFSSWIVNWNNYLGEEGYREASEAVMKEADDSVALCALGGARSVWKYYIHRPLATPQSIADIQKLSERHKEVRCVYHQASWQSSQQTEIAQFLLRNAWWSRVKDVTVFIYPTSTRAVLPSS